MNDLDHLRQHIINSETFCFYPFTQLSTSPSGLLKPCCNYVGTLHDGVNGDINIHKGDTFKSAWNSHAMTETRREMVEGVIPEKCRRCIRDGETSMRNRSIMEYKNDPKTLRLVKDTIENDFKAKHLPTYLELKPSNLCNLKCVMCNSYDSSQIKKELQELNDKFKGILIHDGRFIEIVPETPELRDGNKYVNFEDVEWHDRDDMWKEFEEIVPSLEVLSFAGGEPTIMPSVMRALRFCVDSGYAKNIKVFLSSNFTNLNKQFFDLMPHFRKFELIASIDGFEKTQEYCRFPSKWSQISKNYIEAKKYMQYPNVKILVNVTVSLFNVLNLTELLDWIEERANEYPYYSEWPYNINLIFYPQEQQIGMLPQDLRGVAVARLDDYIRRSKLLKEFPGMEHNIRLLMHELTNNSRYDKVVVDDKEIVFQTHQERQEYMANLMLTCSKRVRVLDEHREIHIKDYIPELAKLFYDNLE